jgi:small subunit ribosomal protein S8
MALHDPISDLLTRIRNAKDAKHRYVDVPLSKAKINVIKVLEQHGFIEHHLINDELRKVRVFLKYVEGRECVMQGLRRISSPGLRRYVGHKDIPKILGGMGIAILSTPQGVIDGETARKQKVGGELLCYVW